MITSDTQTLRNVFVDLRYHLNTYLDPRTLDDGDPRVFERFAREMVLDAMGKVDRSRCALRFIHAAEGVLDATLTKPNLPRGVQPIYAIQEAIALACTPPRLGDSRLWEEQQAGRVALLRYEREGRPRPGQFVLSDKL